MLPLQVPVNAGMLEISKFLTTLLLIQTQDPQLVGSSGSLRLLLHLPTHQEPQRPFSQLPKELASPTATTMQQLTGLQVKGNVRPNAQNIKISDKGPIVVHELVNFRLIREPLSFTNQPGAMQHPWLLKKKKDKPRNHAPNYTDPAFHVWRLCYMWELFYLLVSCLERSTAPAQCNTGFRAGG